VKRGKKGASKPEPNPGKPPMQAKPTQAKPTKAAAKTTKAPPPGWQTAPVRQKAPICDQSPAKLGQIAAARGPAPAERTPPWKRREAVPEASEASACQRSAASTGCPSDTASARSSSPHGGLDERRVQQQERTQALTEALANDPRKAEPAPSPAPEPVSGPLQAFGTLLDDIVAPAGGYLTASRGELVSVSYAEGDWLYGQVADRAGWFARGAVVLS